MNLFSFSRQLYLMYLQRLQRLVAKPPAHLQMCGPSPKIVLANADKLSSFKLHQTSRFQVAKPWYVQMITPAKYVCKHRHHIG